MNVVKVAFKSSAQYVKFVTVHFMFDLLFISTRVAADITFSVFTFRTQNRRLSYSTFTLQYRSDPNRVHTAIHNFTTFCPLVVAAQHQVPDSYQEALSQQMVACWLTIALHRTNYYLQIKLSPFISKRVVQRTFSLDFIVGSVVVFVVVATFNDVDLFRLKTICRSRYVQVLGCSATKFAERLPPYDDEPFRSRRIRVGQYCFGGARSTQQVRVR